MLLRTSLTRALTRTARRALPSTQTTPHFIQHRPSKSRLLTSTPTRPSSTPMAASTDTAAAAEASASGVSAESLTETLEAKLDATHVEVEDMSGGCGQAFNALIVSPQFEKKTLLARHRLVNGVLKAEIAAIHAWTPRCLTPEQWAKEKEKMGGEA